MDFIADVVHQITNISVITEIEASSWMNPDKSKEAIVQEFIQDATVLGLTPDVISECVKIRRSKKIKTPYAIIAASAIVHSLTLITSDSDFNNIQGLQVINPNSL